MAKIPEQIDKYKIEELIASGGMGAVFRGKHPTLGRSVILKKLTLRGNAAITERFKREARILMDFRNDNIVDVQDHFVQGRSHYIVMEYVDGQSLKDLLDEQRYLDNCTAAYITLYTAKALQYAHSKGVVHRDIKPGNILISRRGEIKLADFGIASSGDEIEEDTLTTDGMTLGTPAYMAPEQFENSRTVDYRADLYSLGVMMYEMLTGLKPFPGSFTPETVRRIQKGKYKSPEKVNPSISPVLRSIIHSLIKPKPQTRGRDIGKIISRLEKWLEGYDIENVRSRLCAMIKEEPVPPIQKKGIGARKLYITVAVVILIIMALCVGICNISGIHKRIFSPDEYGQLGFSVNVYPSKSAVIPYTELFVDDGKDIPRVDTVVRYFPQKTPRGKTYRSLPLILPAGSYRAKTTIGDKIIWSSFGLKSWNEQNGTRKILLTDSADAPTTVSLTVGIHDAATGADISETTAAEVYINGKFVPVKPVRFYSDKVYNFRISAPGYETQEYILRINKNESSLHIQAELRPETSKETQ